MSNKDFYNILGVSNDASDDEIRKAYKKAALKYHPDKNRGNPEAEQMFKRVAEAYDVLSDKDKRRVYDLYGEEGLKSGVGGGDPSHAGGVPVNIDPFELFSRFFGADDMDTFGFPSSGGVKRGFPGNVRVFRTTGGMPGQAMHFSFGGDEDPFMGSSGQFQSFFGGPQMRASRSSELDAGTEVTLSGLKSNPNLNGKTAIILGMDASTGRYQVQVQGDQNVISVKPENLTPKRSSRKAEPRFRHTKQRRQSSSGVSTGVSVRLVNTNNPSVNGQVAVVKSYDPATQRYVVSLENSSGDMMFSVRPENIELFPGTSARVTGLMNAAQYNDSSCVVGDFDESSGRYNVNLGDGTQIRIRPENLRVC